LNQNNRSETGPARSSSRWIATLVVFGMVVTAGFYFYSRQPAFAPPSGPIDGLPGTEGASRPAPDLSTRTIDGQALRLGAFRGKVLVVDFWATWCAPCREEIPHLVQLTEKYRSKGLEVIGLTIEDPAADAERIRRFMERFLINYTVGFATDDIFRTHIGPGEQPIPQTLVFDRQGRLQAHLVGFSSKRGDPQKLESLITRLL
jgi:thiol-disulfide isomerase/thioredoxin